MDPETPEHLLKTKRREPVTMLEAISEALFEAVSYTHLTLPTICSV